MPKVTHPRWVFCKTYNTMNFKTIFSLCKKAGLACAPANALPEVKKVAHLVTAKEGGLGAVREACDFILKSQGNWEKVMHCVETAHWPPITTPGMKVVRESKTRGKK